MYFSFVIIISCHTKIFLYVSESYSNYDWCFQSLLLRIKTRSEQHLQIDFLQLALKCFYFKISSKNDTLVSLLNWVLRFKWTRPMMMVIVVIHSYTHHHRFSLIHLVWYYLPRNIFASLLPCYIWQLNCVILIWSELWFN